MRKSDRLEDVKNSRVAGYQNRVGLISYRRRIREVGHIFAFADIALPSHMVTHTTTVLGTWFDIVVENPRSLEGLPVAGEEVEVVLLSIWACVFRNRGSLNERRHRFKKDGLSSFDANSLGWRRWGVRSSFRPFLFCWHGGSERGKSLIADQRLRA